MVLFSFRPTADAIVAAVATHYEITPGSGGMFALEEVFRRYRSSHLFELRSEDGVPARAAFLGFELIAAIVPHVPSLARHVAGIATAAANDADARLAWNEIEPSYLENDCAPAIPASADRIDPRDYLAPESGILRSHDAVDATTPASYFHLWRDPERFGVNVAINGRNHIALKQFHPDVAAAGTAMMGPVIDVPAFERGYLAHLDREARRALHPFGLRDVANRATVVAAVAISYESETAGTFDRALRSIDINKAVTPVGVFKRIVDDQMRPHAKGKRGRNFSLLPFDLLRIAAASQRYVSAHGAIGIVDDDGWCRPLRKQGLGVSPESWRGAVKLAGVPRLPFARELLKLLPYSEALAERIERMWPAGSRRKMSKLSKDSKFRDTRRNYLTEAIIFSLRSSVLDSIWRERAMNERLGVPAQKLDLFQVNTAAENLMAFRLNDELGKSRKVPREVGFDIDKLAANEQETAASSVPGKGRASTHKSVWARLDSDRWLAFAGQNALTRAEMIGRPTPKWPTKPGTDPRPPAVVVPPLESVYEFLKFVEPHRDAWIEYRKSSAKQLTRAELSGLKQLNLFCDWLWREFGARDAAISDEAASFALEIASGELDRGRVLPTHLHGAEPSKEDPTTLAAAFRAWTLTMPASERSSAREAAQRTLREIFESSMWHERSNDLAPGSYLAATKAERRAASRAAFESENLLEEEVIPEYSDGIVDGEIEH